MTFVNPEVVPNLIAEFVREKEHEDAEMVAQELRTQGASSCMHPFIDEQLEVTQVTGDSGSTLTQVINDSVGSVQPADDTAP